MCTSVKDPDNLLLISGQGRRQRCLASRRVTFSVLEAFSSVSPFTLQVQQFADLDNDAKDKPGFVGNHWLDLFSRGKVTTSLICIFLSYVGSDKVLARSCFNHLPANELPLGRRHYPLTIMAANFTEPAGS
jgi:hypothetical protein